MRSVGPDVSRRHDVQESHLPHPTWMIERQSMRRSRSPIMTGKVEAVVAERGHHINLVLRHRTERVVDVVGPPLRRANAVAVTPKVRRDDVESLAERAGDLVPRRVTHRVAVQQQQRRAVAAVPQEDVGTLRANPSSLEAREEPVVWREPTDLPPGPVERPTPPRRRPRTLCDPSWRHRLSAEFPVEIHQVCVRGSHPVCRSMPIA